jgi:hypothetical protein
MKIRKLKIKANRWPWQGYGWFPHKDSENRKAAAILNPIGSRFGAGWNYKLGVSVGSRTVIIDLLFGSFRISYSDE